MDAANFALEAEVERTHWWFSGRRRLFARELVATGLSRDARILDVGTGTGANLRMLRDLKLEHVTGLDSDELAIQFCASKGLGKGQIGDICAMPFEPGVFDLVIATDVIEHVDDDRAALGEIVRVLNEGGKVLITVPAFPSLWGLQDIVAHHKRRYRLGPLLQRMREAGLEPHRYYHFNYLLFVPIWVARRLMRWLGIKLKSELELNNPLLNRLLSGIFRITSVQRLYSTCRLASPFWPWAGKPKYARGDRLSATGSPGVRLRIARAVWLHDSHPCLFLAPMSAAVALDGLVHRRTRMICDVKQRAIAVSPGRPSCRELTISKELRKLAITAAVVARRSLRFAS